MNWRISYRYQMWDLFKSVRVYYAVIVALLLALLVSTLSIASIGEGTFSSLDMASLIFLFVGGLCSIKEPFGMMLQNGVSRREFFQAKLITAGSIAFCMAAVDLLLLLILRGIVSSITDRIQCITMLDQLYESWGSGQPFLSLYAFLFLFDFCLYASFFLFGSLISLIFYRLNKLGKTLVGAGTPVFFCILLPLADQAWTGGRITGWMIETLGTITGIFQNNPWYMIVTATVCTIVYACGIWLLLRKAVLKKA